MLALKMPVLSVAGRKAVKAVLALGSVTLLSVAALAAERDLTFVAWGGTTQDAQYAAWAPPFTKMTGKNVSQDKPTNYGKLKAMVEAGNVSWDVVDVDGDWAHRAARDGLLEKLDFSQIDTKGVDKKYYFDYGVADFAFAYVLGYNKTAMKSKVPEGWKDFFDTAKFPGKRGVIGWPTGGLLEAALLADGVEPAKLYPLDVDRAFRKLSTIKDQLVFWQSGGEAQQLLASGQIAMCFCWDSRVNYLKRDGADVDVQWNQNITTVDYLVVPKGSPNKEAAMKFISVAASPEGSAKMAEGVLTGPPNADAQKYISKDVWNMLVTAHKDQSIDINLEYWRDHGDEIEAAWNAWKIK